MTIKRNYSFEDCTIKEARKQDSQFKNFMARKTLIVCYILVLLSQTQKVPTNRLTAPFPNASSLSFSSKCNSLLILTKGETEAELKEACYCICSQISENQNQFIGL